MRNQFNSLRVFRQRKKTKRTPNMKVEWGQAKIEFNALRCEIIPLIIDGYPSTRIYATLKNDGKLTSAARTFCRYIKSLREEIAPRQLADPTHSETPKGRNRQLPKASSGSQTAIDTFVHHPKAPPHEW